MKNFEKWKSPDSVDESVKKIGLIDRWVVSGIVLLLFPLLGPASLLSLFGGYVTAIPFIAIVIFYFVGMYRSIIDIFVGERSIDVKLSRNSKYFACVFALLLFVWLGPDVLIKFWRE